MKSSVEGAALNALFISRAGADADFASVIGRILEAAGYSVSLQQWDFANHNFMERMHAALVSGARVIALLSPEYLRSDHCQAEWLNAIADDPLNTQGRLILLRVGECEPLGLLRGIAYWDLVPIRDQRMLVEATVRAAVSQERNAAEPAGPYWRAPRAIIEVEAVRPVPSFSGRDRELAEIAAALGSEGSIVALCGLGGVGKSSVAREYAWRNRDQYSVVWWCNAETEDGIIDGLLRLGSLFARGLDQIADRRLAAQQVTGSILTGFAKPVFLSFDNLEDERLLRTWQPRTGSRALVTSRSASWGPGITAISMDRWPPDTAVSYLQHESGRSDLDTADANAIVDALGGLPLALSHAAASLRSMRMLTPARYLGRIGEHLRNAPRTADYPSSVFATFSTAIAQAEQQAPGAAAVLCFASRFAPDAIPDELLRENVRGATTTTLQPTIGDGIALDLGAVVEDEVRFDEALGALDRLSLLAFAQDSMTYSMHRLVQFAARDLAQGDAGAWQRCAVAAAEAAFADPSDVSNWSQCERLLPHARAALYGLPDDSGLLVAGALAQKCAQYLWRRGDYSAAEQLSLRSLAIREDALGPDHSDVAQSLNLVGRIAWSQGRFVEAESVHRRSLAIRENAFGTEHPDVAESLDSLGVTCDKQGRSSEAEQLHLRALAIREKVLGPEHPLVALTLNNLAVSLYGQGRFADGEPFQRRAVEVCERALGPEHPQVTLGLTNLAMVCREQGRFADAEDLSLRSASIAEKALGPNHPELAKVLNVLALVYADQERYAEAEATHVRALTIQEKALGLEHPDIAQNLNNLAKVYRLQGRYAEAESLFVRAVSMRENTCGLEHPAVAESLNDLAKVYSDQGRPAEAEQLLQRALAILEVQLGPGYPLTAEVSDALRRLGVEGTAGRART